MALQGTVCIWAARPALMALRARGLDEAPVLREAQLSARALEDVDNRLTYETVGQLWEVAADAARDPFFGAHVAGALPKGSCDLIEYLAAGSSTLGEAYERITK